MFVLTAMSCTSTRHILLNMMTSILLVLLCKTFLAQNGLLCVDMLLRYESLATSHLSLTGLLNSSKCVVGSCCWLGSVVVRASDL